MHYIPKGSHSWYSLPRDGGIAYAAQQSWVMNATIKVLALNYITLLKCILQENILFNTPYDEERYQKGLLYPHLTQSRL